MSLTEIEMMTERFSEVLIGCRLGDPQAMRLLIVEFYGTLMRTARRRLRSEDRAKDAVQSFFLVFLEKHLILEFRGTRVGQLRSFLNACIVNHINSSMREYAQQNTETEIDSELLRSPYPSVEDEFERKSIRELIRQIDWRYRQVLDLELEFYKQREIAGMLNIPPGTVASYSHRAKAALARLLRANGFVALPFLLGVLLHLRLAA